VLRDWEALVTSRFVVTEAHLAVDAEAIRIEIVDRPQRPVAIVIVRFKAAWEANWRTVSLFPPGERERSIPVRRPSALVPLAWQSQSTWILAGDGQPAERRQGAVVAGTGLTVGVELPPA
jgi:hypothetical protein